MPQLVLLKPHTHAGKSFGIGERLDVDVPTFEWLLAQGIARPEPLNQKFVSITETAAVNPSHPSKNFKEPKP
jgi:hypothetical protein